MIDITIPPEYLTNSDVDYLSELVMEFLGSKMDADLESFSFSIEVSYTELENNDDAI